MKVLIVEDDSDKAAHISEALDSAGVSSEEVTLVTDGRAARSAMRSTHFDLAVIDLVLPIRALEPPVRHGGLDLIREVRSREIYLVPTQFLILSAFDDVISEAGADLADEVLVVLRYDAASLVWRERLARQVSHLRSAASTSTLARSPQADVCIVTALRDPELLAVLDLPWTWEEVEVIGDGTLYYRGRASGTGGGSLDVVAACTSQMGMVASAVLTSKMCMLFRPRVVAMCGILAAVDRDIGLGDIVVADPTWNYESGKHAIEEGSGDPVFRFSPSHIPLDPWLRERCGAISSDQGFLDGLRRDFSGSAATTALAMHLGPVASGSAVVGDPEYLRSARIQHRKLVGIEMETYGVFAASHEAQMPRPMAVSLKSVSDYADSEKSDSYQRYAAYTSAGALRRLVEAYVKPHE